MVGWACLFLISHYSLNYIVHVLLLWIIVWRDDMMVLWNVVWIQSIFGGTVSLQVEQYPIVTAEWWYTCHGRWWSFEVYNILQQSSRLLQNWKEQCRTFSLTDFFLMYSIMKLFVMFPLLLPFLVNISCWCITCVLVYSFSSVYTFVS